MCIKGSEREVPFYEYLYSLLAKILKIAFTH